MATWLEAARSQNWVSCQIHCQNLGTKDHFYRELKHRTIPIFIFGLAEAFHPFLLQYFISSLCLMMDHFSYVMET